MKKRSILTLLTLLLSFSGFALTPITGSTTICMGSFGAMRDTTLGGTWTCSNTAVATIGSSSGLVTPVSMGTATITYTLGTYVTTTITVSGTTPAPIITGLTSFCPGVSTTLSDPTPGGIWSSSAPGVASVGSTTGIVTGGGSGSATIYYSVGGCSVATSVTVLSKPVVYLAGVATVCVGSVTTLTDSLYSGSGTWSSSNTAVATVSGGIVTGVSAGSATISFAIAGTCGTGVGTKVVTVSSTTSPGTISGTSSVYIGASTTLYDGVGGGTWTSSNTTIATVNSSTGAVTGVAVGSAVITYTVSGCGGVAFTTATMSVTAFNGISGHVLFSGTSCRYNLKVWLITYNPSTFDLQAVDSVSLYCSGSGSVYYQFPAAPTDSFRVKAATDDTTTWTTGYIPTYHNSSFYWYSANVFYHTTGTADINKDITMLTGTISSGPGFIGGSVLTGANKGTAGGGAPGISMYLVNSSGAVQQQTKTNASGNYSFGNLPVGVYSVFPESLNYLTTPYSSINITSAAASKAEVSFTQHTVSHTITPLPQLCCGWQPSSSFFVFPKPSNGKLNLQWQLADKETGSLTVTDVTGRIVYRSEVVMKAGSGTHQADLSGLQDGVYLINVKSESVNYNTKLQIAK